MSVLGTNKDRGAAAFAPVMQVSPDRTGFFQNVSAGFQGAVAGPHSTRNADAIYQSRAYDQIVSALKAEGEQGVDYVQSPVAVNSPFYNHVDGEQVKPDGSVFLPIKRDFRNPFDPGPSLTHESNPIQGLYLGGDQAERDQIWSSVQRVRARKPDFLKQFPDQGSLEKWALDQRQKDASAAGDVTSRASTLGTVGSFIGGMAGTIASGDPENAVGGIGGTAAAKTVARTVLKRATEGAVANTAAGIVAVPGQAEDAQHLGQPMSVGDMAHSVAQNAAVGFVLGGAHAAAPHVISQAGDVTGTVAGKVAEHLPAQVRDPLVAASIRAGTVKDRGLLYEFQRLHNPYGVVDSSTPDERAAAHTVMRDAENQEASPLQPSAVAHNEQRMSALAQSLSSDLPTPELPTTAPIQTPTVKDQPASYTDAINHAEGHTRNPRSTADGYGNFLDSTWLSVAPHVTDTTGMSKDQILSLRHDKDIAGKATEYYAAQNGRFLRAHGLEDSPGNLSLAHFLGAGDAAKVLKADPSTPVESLLSSKVVQANHEVLQGKSADEVIAWAHKRIGATVDHPPARPDAVEGYDYGDVPPHQRATFTPDEISTDAPLMQYKSGGDENGVTGKLADVDKWNPIESSEIMVWQPNEGGNVVVDGHQRVALAKRLYQDDPSIRLPAIVLREADGITPETARVLGALRNIKMGTGSLEDNARVLREAPHVADMLKGAEHRNDIVGLSRLSYEAFGAVLNNVIDPRVGAQIGLHAGHVPDAHMGIVDLLRKERIHSPKEAAAITRQALADGFGTPDAEQLSLLGAAPQQSLYVPIARIMDAATKRLREEKRTFKVLSDKASKIEAVGNVLDKTANESKVIGNDEALAILERTAHSAGPVRDALIRAARSELSGARRADAVSQFLDALGGIDLRQAAAGATAADGRMGELAGQAGSGDAAEEPGLDLFDRSQPSRAQLEKFSDPIGEAAKAQTQSIEHDLAMDEPHQSETVHLFGTPDTGFRVSEEGDAKPIHELMKEAESDELAAEALKNCLAPPKVIP